MRGSWHCVYVVLIPKQLWYCGINTQAPSICPQMTIDPRRGWAVLLISQSEPSALQIRLDGQLLLPRDEYKGVKERRNSKTSTFTYPLQSAEQFGAASKSFGWHIARGNVGVGRWRRLCHQYPRLVAILWGADGLDTISASLVRISGISESLATQIWWQADCVHLSCI